MGKDKGAIAVNSQAALPPWIVLDPLFQGWLLEDIGRGDRTTSAIYIEIEEAPSARAECIIKDPGLRAGSPVASRVFYIMKEPTRNSRSDNGGRDPLHLLLTELDILHFNKELAVSIIERLPRWDVVPALKTDR
jgi:nicotinate-nucleotide pyrophosphorylase (carboxylating)